MVIFSCGLTQSPDSAISHDPELFENPDVFRPERFMDPKDPKLADFDLPFGFGRRICPGRVVAEQALFIVVTRFVPITKIKSIDFRLTLIVQYALGIRFLTCN
jgi:hypothetical protein